MRKTLLLLILPVIISCKNSTQETRQETAAIAAPNPTRPDKFTFGAVTYTYESMGEVKNAVLVSEVQNNYGLSEDEEYQLLDYISNNVRIQTANKHSVDQRKVYTFNSYKEASEKRQDVIKHGIN